MDIIEFGKLTTDQIVLSNIFLNYLMWSSYNITNIHEITVCTTDGDGVSSLLVHVFMKY